MSTTKQLKVYKGLPTIIKSRARGYYDDKTILTFNTDAESQNITMDVYDGLSYDIASSASGVKILDFVNTVLPYKWDYSTALSTNRYCFAPVSENMYYVDFYKYNNFTKIGSPTVDENTGLVSGFSTSNYILPKDNFAITAHSTPWEVKVKFKLTSSKYNPLFGGACGSYMPDLFITNDNLLAMAVSSNGSSYDIINNVTGTTPLSLDTVYYAKYGWTGTEYYAEYSTDDVTYTRELTVSSSTGMYSQSSGFYIGFRCGSSLDGVVYLSDTSISFNGVEWWRGATLNRELMPGILSNYTDDGSAVTLNCFANGDTSVVLTPDDTYNGTYLGTVNIQAHTAYNYDPDTGEWTPNV